MLNLTNPFAAAGSATPWLPLLHLVYVLTGVLMATGYVGQIRKCWHQPQASLLAQSMPSWLLWTACRVVALCYGIWVIGDAAFVLVVSLDVAGRIGVVAALLRARHLHRGGVVPGRRAYRGWNRSFWPADCWVARPFWPADGWVARPFWPGVGRVARQALVCALLLPACVLQAQPIATAVLNAAQQATYASARQMLKRGQYAAAYGRFAELAEQGHRASARMALVLYDLGPDVLGQAWSATPNQRRRWQVLAQQSEQERTFGADTEVRD